VYIARDGSEAIEILENIVPNIIILDIMMTNVDGYQTLKYIKSKRHLEDVKTIFLSAKSKASDIEKGLSLGADEYILKPFSVKKLVSAVNELLN